MSGADPSMPEPFSQADIDAALAGASPAPEPAAAPNPDSAPAEPPAGQADIDATLAAAEEVAGETPADAGAMEGGPAATPAEVKLDSAGRPFDEAAAMMAAAIAEEKAAAAPPPGAVPLELPDFPAAPGDQPSEEDIQLIGDVELNVKIELGRAIMLIEDILRLGEGSVVELDKLAGDPVDVLVNDRLVARGEVLVLNDNFCVRISEIVAGAEETAAA
jgi:flagellar motor switch protein FliN/FliY